MTTYYKATRTDGTDFRTGRVYYEVGKTVKPLPTDETPRICGPGMLHAADVPAETLLGGSWPCRLFEVTGDPVVGFDTEKHPHKAGFLELTVIREIDAHLALGPNGRDVAALIERAVRLTEDEKERLGAARDAARGAAQKAARAPARDAAYGAARSAARSSAWDAAWDAARNVPYGAARSAARDAALALLTRDLITPGQFDIIYGLWASVIEI